jgi:putative hydrolase of the HAD superfamily
MKECFKKAKIYDLLDNFTFSYSLRIGKPKLQIFKTAIEAMNISPMESVMVGDNLATDIKPAIELGMKTIWLNNSKKTNNSNIIPNAESSSIAEILKYI